MCVPLLTATGKFFMTRDARAYLWDVQDACSRIAEFTCGLDISAYTTNDLVRSAVERQLTIVGEALSQLSKLDPALANRIPEHRQIIAFRNVLIHGYADLDHERVWHEAAQGLPRLAVAINLLLAEAGPPNTPYP